MTDSTLETGLSQESWTVIGTGIALLVALGGLMLTLSAWQRDDIQHLRTEFNQLRTEFHGLRTEFQGLRTEFQGLRTEFQGLRTDVGAEIGEVRNGQTELRERLTRTETTISIAHPALNARTATRVESNT